MAQYVTLLHFALFILLSSLHKLCFVFPFMKKFMVIELVWLIKSCLLLL